MQLVFSVFFMAILGFGSPVFAQGWPWDAGQPLTNNPTCDSDIWKVHKARAWMEGKHDMEAAQTIIRKPDSIIAYSCFDLHAAQVGWKADEMFSDAINSGRLFKTRYYNWPIRRDSYELQIGPGNPRIPRNGFCVGPACFTNFGPDPPLSGGGTGYSNLETDNAIILLTRAALKMYLHQNFYYELIPPPWIICENMAAIWHSYKCTNFDKGWFWTFQQLVGDDPRKYPVPCNSQREIWAAAIPVVNPPPASPPAAGGVEAVKTFLNYFYAPFMPSCSSPPPIPTGVIVTRDGQKYRDAVCPGIGCSYVPQGPSSGICR